MNGDLYLAHFPVIVVVQVAENESETTSHDVQVSDLQRGKYCRFMYDGMWNADGS